MAYGTHELTAAVLTSPRPAQIFLKKEFQDRLVGGSSSPTPGRAIGNLWLLGLGGSRSL